MTAVSLDTVSVLKGSGAGNNSISWSHTVGNSANGFVVGLAATASNSGNRFATGVTYNGVNMSSLTSQFAFAALSSVTNMSELWYLANPATGANTVSATFGNGVHCDGFGVSLIGVSGTSATGAPASAIGNSTTASVTGIPANGSSDFVVAVAVCNGNAAGGPTLSVTANGQTLSAWTRTGTNGADSIGGVDTAQAAGASSGMSVLLSSSRSWVMTGVAILASGGGGGGGGPTGGGAYFYRRRRMMH